MIKRKIQFQNYKNCLKAAESDNKKYMLKKTKLSQIVLKNHNKFMINNKSELKSDSHLPKKFTLFASLKTF